MNVHPHLQVVGNGLGCNLHRKMEALPQHAFQELANLIVQVADKQHVCFFDAQDLQISFGKMFQTTSA